jgi:hypothetical protein
VVTFGNQKKDVCQGSEREIGLQITGYTGRKRIRKSFGCQQMDYYMLIQKVRIPGSAFTARDIRENIRRKNGNE